jgi:hypothetical protein
MFTKTQLFDMNYDKKYSSFGWIKNIEKTCDDNKLFKLYATNKSSLSGREYIALPSDKILTASDYLKYDIMK